MKHAARSQRWRRRRAHRRAGCAGDVVANGSAVNFVTHQGCAGALLQAPLPACEQVVDVVSPNASGALGNAAAMLCRRCGAALLPYLRQGFLRYAAWRRESSNPCP